MKCLYGKQEGAIVGYNPKKPGRPSHSYHSALMANTRLALAVEVMAGNETAPLHNMPGIWAWLDALPKAARPAVLRGDVAYGNEAVLREAEARDQPYLTKLRLTKHVKDLIKKLFRHTGWADAGQGWEARESAIRLLGWQRERRVVVLRRPIRGEMALADKAQQWLGFIEAQRGVTAYEHAVLITTLSAERFDLLMMAQLYRDRADCENGFDELKNQWGWGGYTTHDLGRCQLAAQAVALIYNWWNLYLRLIEPRKHLEAITSRPLMLTAVATASSHANQLHLRITPLHAFAAQAIRRLQAISAQLKEWVRTAEQLPDTTAWQHICKQLSAILLALNRLRCHFLPVPTLPKTAANCGF